MAEVATVCFFDGIGNAVIRYFTALFQQVCLCQRVGRVDLVFGCFSTDTSAIAVNHFGLSFCFLAYPFQDCGDHILRLGVSPVTQYGLVVRIGTSDRIRLYFSRSSGNGFVLFRAGRYFPVLPPDQLPVGLRCADFLGGVHIAVLKESQFKFYTQDTAYGIIDAFFRNLAFLSPVLPARVSSAGYCRLRNTCTCPVPPGMLVLRHRWSVATLCIFRRFSTSPMSLI